MVDQYTTSSMYSRLATSYQVNMTTMWLWELRAVSLSHAVFFLALFGVRIGEGVNAFGHHLHACDTLQRLVLRHLAVGDDDELTWLHRTTHLLTYLHVPV